MNVFVGIDVSSEKHNCCILDEQEHLLTEFVFQNNREGFDCLLSKLEHPLMPDKAKTHIGLEATGVYGNNLTEFLRRNGFKTTTFNPLAVKKQLSATTLRKTKTDKADARFIATVLARGNFKPDALPLYHTSELKSLSRKRFSLVKKSSAAKNVAKALISKLFPEYIGFFSDTFGSSSIAVLSSFPSASDIARCRPSSLAKLLSKSSRGRFGDTKAKDLIALAKSSVGVYSCADALSLSLSIEEISFFSSQIVRLESAMKDLLNDIDSPVLSIPGISTVLGAMIVSEIGNISRFSNHNKLLAYAGLDPSIYQSGKFSPSSGSMVKRGSPYLRWALMFAARTVPNSSSTFQAFRDKKLAEGKHFNVVSSHVAKKLVRVIFSLLVSDSHFCDSFS